MTYGQPHIFIKISIRDEEEAKRVEEMIKKEGLFLKITNLEKKKKPIILEEIPKIPKFVVISEHHNQIKGII